MWYLCIQRLISMKTMTNYSSDFIPPTELNVSTQFEQFEEMPSKGHSMLLRAKRDEQWWCTQGPETR